MEFLPARFQESRATLDVDLLERLEAVGGKSRADHVHASTPSLPSARNVAAVYGCSHSAAPKRDWKVTSVRGSFQPSSIAMRRALSRHCFSYGSPACTTARGMPWKLITSRSGRPVFIQ